MQNRQKMVESFGFARETMGLDSLKALGQTWYSLLFFLYFVHITDTIDDGQTF